MNKIRMVKPVLGLTIGLMGILFFGCKDEVVTEPRIVTSEVTEIGLNSAVCGGSVAGDGGAQVTDRGVCWSTDNPEPTIEDDFIPSGTGKGSFSITLTDLDTNKFYFARAYATNSKGTVYGEAMFFKTAEVTDADGNAYRTVTIGNQVWMVDNLKTTKFNDGSDIPLVSDATQWSALSTPGFCWMNNNEAKKSFGALYNWYAIVSDKLCPAGWHVPSNDEWNTMITHLGGINLAGGKLKETGIKRWISPNTGATNSTYFSAQPGSFRNNSGGFGTDGYFGYWWTSSAHGIDPLVALVKGLQYNSIKVFSEDVHMGSGLYVRCIKD